MTPQESMQDFDSRYPATEDLRQRVFNEYEFAFEYLDGGCNEDVNLDKNMSDIQKVELDLVT